jgi:glycolate oxidase FAD binding subunit
LSEGGYLEALERVVGSPNLKLGKEATDYQIDELAPELVVAPGSEEEVAQVLEAAARYGRAVAPWGGGTMIPLGNPPARLDTVVSLKRLNRVREYEPADLTATVEAGVTLGDLQARLGRERQLLPLDPPGWRSATLGGIAATNASGPWRLLYGSMRELALGARMALPDGRVVRSMGRVVKNVAGYDLKRLFIGSLGTLGIITELSFTLQPAPETKATHLARFERLEEAWNYGLKVVHSTLQPTALALLTPSMAGHLKLGGGFLVMIDLWGVAADVDLQLGRLDELAVKGGASAKEAMDGRRAEGLWERVRTMTAPRSDGVLLKVVTPIVSGITLLQEAHRQLAEPAVVTYVGCGIQYIRLPAGQEEARLAGIIEALRQEALRQEGYLVVEAAPTSLKRRVDVWGPLEARELGLMKAVKARFDPKGVMNPGRFVGGI